MSISVCIQCFCPEPNCDCTAGFTPGNLIITKKGGRPRSCDCNKKECTICDNRKRQQDYRERKKLGKVRKGNYHNCGKKLDLDAAALSWLEKLK